MGDALSFTAKGTFILGKLHAHDAGKLKDVLADVYRDAVPDPMDISRFEWEVILFMRGGRSPPPVVAAWKDSTRSRPSRSSTRR